MVVDVKRQICDGHMFKWLMAAGLTWLEHNQKLVNSMNVFPVPDGDTGTNMRLTMKKAYDAIAQQDDPNVGIVSEAVAKGALLGARGNSGVILSQYLYGFSLVLKEHEILDLPLFARACERAVELGYKAVQSPVEGTILTVAREASQAINDYAKQNLDLVEGFEVMLAAAKDALSRTPDMLPILKKAGVVDSGGQGLVMILEGMNRLLRGDPVYIQDLHQIEEQNWQDVLEPEDSEGYGYDVQFLIHGETLNVAQVRSDIEAMGWSALVVGDESLIKVHVHVHDPGVPLSYAISLDAVLDDVVVENMQMQYENYVAKRTADETSRVDDIQPVEGVAVIAVASGEGMRTLFKQDLSVAAVISGGQTMNPSTEDFLAVIEQLPNDEIILLPNNKNIILAAEQAAGMVKGRTVRVIPSRTVPQGIGALIVYISLKDTASLAEIIDGMAEALQEIVTCEVTTATRDVELDGVTVSQGQYIGLVDGRLRIADNMLENLVERLLQEAGADEYELVTVYYGDAVKENQVQTLVKRLQTTFANQEIHLVYGGQPLYPYLISLE